MLVLLAFALMPVIWNGLTQDGCECKLNQDKLGLVAYVGKGGKRTVERVATKTTGPQSAPTLP
jgi:hypothetical protein